MYTIDMRSEPMTDARESILTAEQFETLAEPHWPAMLALARRLVGDVDGEDVAAEALENAWRRRSTFDADRGGLLAWLLALTADRARKSWRRRRPQPSTDEVLERLTEDRYPDVDLERALRHLSRRQRLAVELHYFVRLPVAEIAQVMDCAEGTVKSTLADARSKLRARLGEDYR